VMGRVHLLTVLCFGRVGRSISQIFCPARFLFIGIPVHLIRGEAGAGQRMPFLMTDLVTLFLNRNCVMAG
jgi:hypothetical protein